jgi:hypothetical protein
MPHRSQGSLSYFGLIAALCATFLSMALGRRHVPRAGAGTDGIVAG